LPTTVDHDVDIARVVERYYDIADNITAATAAGCRILPIEPFALALRQETDVRNRLAAC